MPRRFACVLVCAALTGCASSEGGVTGTGISAISGNITLVSEQRTPSTATALPFPIRVTVAEFPDVSATTDAGGTFQLRGVFSGAITLQFADAVDGAELGPLQVELLAGSQMVLENIEIDAGAPLPDRVRPTAVRLFDLFGRVDMVECAADGTGMLLVTDDGRPPRQFMMLLTADTDIVTPDGAALTCVDIRERGSVQVEGFLRAADQTVIAVTVTVGAAPPPQPGSNPRPERARGIVESVSCSRGLVEIEQSGIPGPVTRVLQLSEGTVFHCGTDVPAQCDCTAIAVGSPIAVAGTIFPAQPGQIQADVVFLGAVSVPVDVVGTITRLACEIGELAVNRVAAPSSGARVVLTADTEIICRSGLRCACEDLHAGNAIRVEGEQPADGGPIAADRITVLERRGGSGPG